MIIIKINKNIITYEENGELVLLNMVENSFFALDRFSTYIWSEIKEEKNIERVINKVSKECNMEEEVVRKDISSFVLELEKVGILVING